MIPDFIFNIFTGIHIAFLKMFGSSLDKLLIRIAGSYFSYLNMGMIHEDALAKIINEEYADDKKAAEECSYFVYSKKHTVDSIFESKYGRKGRFMTHIFKLVQKIYLDKLLDDKRLSYTAEQSRTTVNLNRNFNKIALYMFSKYG